MAIEFFSSFNGCGTTADMQSLFASCTVVDAIIDSVYYFGSSGKALRINGPSSYAEFYCSTSKTKVFGFYVLNTPQSASISGTANRCLCTFTGPDIRVHNHITNGVSVTLGGSTPPIAMASASIPAGWTHIEIKVFSSATVGTVDIKMNGVSILSASGLNTNGADITGCRVCGHEQTSLRFDNIFTATDWAGELDGIVIYPSSDASVAFTRSGGSTNYELVDDSSGQDGDLTYVVSNNPTDEDFYGYQDVSTEYDIAGVTLVTVARKLDAGTAQIAVKGKQSSTEYTLKTITLATSYPATANVNHWTHLSAAPDSTAWSATKLNAIEWGFENKEV